MDSETRYYALKNLSLDYHNMQQSIKTARSRTREKYRQIGEDEFANLRLEYEREFAQKIKAQIDAGLKGSEIRREVLRTNAWSSWTKWRDLAGLPTRKTKEGGWF